MQAIECSYWEHTGEMRVKGYDDRGKPNHWTPVFRNVLSGEEVECWDTPIGAIIDFAYQGGYKVMRVGSDSRYLACRMPYEHESPYFWEIDGVASNCGRPDDGYHRCWVRHGDPPNLTVDKNGDTCPAGAGSIVVPGKPGWHGFLREGKLVPC